ncbi:MAG: uracil-DNA glycosylase family protein [Panacibacter sp.]
MRTLAQQIPDFLFNLQLPFTMPDNIEVLDVHKVPAVQTACRSFYEKFYNDRNKRHLLIGINPGRFGGGVTGIPFTDPIRLQNDCGIPNSFQKKQELSSAFIYEMINAYGGVLKFYRKFYISAVSPLGFVRNGKNLNYYDDKVLQKRIETFVIDCMEKQITFGLERDICFCIGEGKNLKFLKALNDKHKWFKTIKSFSHPRFVMQYKLKQKQFYIQQYTDALHQLT